MQIFQEVFVVHFVVNETDTQSHKNELERCVQVLTRNHASFLSTLISVRIRMVTDGAKITVNPRHA